MKGVMTRLRAPPVEHCILFGLMPLVLPVVRRAGPPLVVLAASISCLALLSDPRVRSASKRIFKSIPFWVGSAFLCWATATLSWTPWLSRGAAAVASGWLLFGALVALVSRPAKAQDASAPALLSVSISAGALLVAMDLIARQFGLIQAQAEAFRYNMVLVSLVVLLCGCLRDQRAWRRQVAAPASCLAIAVALGESETAKVAYAAAVISYVVSLLMSRTILTTIMASCFCVIWVGFSWIAPIASQLVTLFPGLAKSGHAAERIEIWSAFAQLAHAGLPWGWGVEAVAKTPALPFFETAAATTRAGLDWMHPHNNVIQIAAEMGVPGIALGLAASLVAVWWVQAVPELTPPRAALVAASTTVALISHGFWQMWFWSAVVAGVVALRRPQQAGADFSVSACSISVNAR